MYRSPAGVDMRMGALTRAVMTFIVLVAGGAGPLLADDSVEYQVKAAYLHKFLQFVEWPEDAQAPGATIVLGIASARRFDDSLGKLEGLVVNGRELRLTRISKLEDVTGCAVVFVAKDAHAWAGEVISLARDHAILTIGESEAFATEGGVMNFYVADESVRFEVNVDAAERAGLTVSSRLLRLARIVHEQHAENKAG